MAETRVERRLAAILAADVVGFARLMELDEAGTIEALQARRAQVLGPLVAAHRGRIFKLIGDGALIEFGSAVDAVQCAVRLQAAMAVANADLAPQRRIDLRIGINVGDVIVQGRDLYGECVNVAARLEGIAEPGGICVTHAVFEQVRRKLDCEFEDIGPRSVKSIAEPIHVHRVRPDTGPTAPPLSLPTKPSIAVLPFTNLSGDPDQEPFADGLTQDLITELSRHAGLFVIARHSSFAYKGKSVDARQIAGELGVRHLVEGSARRSGDRVRISVQLIDAIGGASLGRSLRPPPRGHLHRSGRGDRQDCRGAARSVGPAATAAQAANEHRSLRAMCARAHPAGALAGSGAGGDRDATAGDHARSGLRRGASLVGHAPVGRLGELG